MARVYAGQLKWVGSAFGRGTCKIEIDDIDSLEWQGTPETFSLIRTRRTPPSEVVTVELLDGPDAEAIATAELFVDLAEQSVMFRGQTAFRPSD